MRLTQQTDYALRLLMHLATHGDDLCTIAEIAGRYAISKNHLMKVAQALSNAGLIDALRGRSGGLRLARPAEEIPLGAVMRLMEPDFALVECQREDGGACLITPACRLPAVLNKAMRAFLEVLDGHTLADLTRRNTPLRALLTGDAA